jgi:ATP-binding cassette subfamily F protein uup
MQNTKIDPTLSVIDSLFDNDNELTQTIKKYEQLVQDPNSSPEELSTIVEKMEEIQARDYENKIKTIVSRLKITDCLQKKISSLSGGELKRVSLAKVLVNEPDFLILDEPTNHLDLEMIERLENYLCSQSTTLLMVTHDRYFLEKVCSTIFELDR